MTNLASAHLIIMLKVLGVSFVLKDRMKVKTKMVAGRVYSLKWDSNHETGDRR
jgi:hypothetical protein